MRATVPFTDEQARNLVNFQMQYDVWMAAEREYRALPYNLVVKTVKDREYLYEIFDRKGNGTSLGPLNDELQARLDAYRETKLRVQAARAESAAALDRTGRVCRALRVPMLASRAGELLREADRREMLGSHLLVVGTNAMIAYAIEAGGAIVEAPQETDDFDLAWAMEEPVDGQQFLWDMLRAVDSTYTVNTERPFQARNKDAYEVEILVAPSRASSMGRTDRPKPVPLEEQEWLLLGQQVDHVVVCRDASPARIVAPDPRWFALQKLWMSRQPKRNALKRPKDEKQGIALLNAVAEAMPRFPLDKDFERSLPAELVGEFKRWKDQHKPESGPAWAT